MALSEVGTVIKSGVEGCKLETKPAVLMNVLVRHGYDVVTWGEMQQKRKKKKRQHFHRALCKRWQTTKKPKKKKKRMCMCRPTVPDVLKSMGDVGTNTLQRVS